MNSRIILFVLAALLTGKTFAVALSGSYNIGAAELAPNFTTIAAAISSLNTDGVSGAVTFYFTDASYTEGNLSITSTSPTSANTVTFQPAAGLAVSIAYSAANNPVFTLDGTGYIIFDGINSGGASLSISNATNGNASSVFKFVNGANNNTVTKCTVRGSSATTTIGIIHFSTSTGTGNISNTIDQCNIYDAHGDGTLLPYNAIYSAGTAAKLNINSITSNNIYNWTNYGINITGFFNGDGWIITGNSFYYNSSTAASAAQYAINLVGVSYSGHTVSNNYIGGQAPNCVGSAWVNSGNVAFTSIYINVGTASTTSVQNNTIQNINLTGTGVQSFWGIYTQEGLFDVGGTTGNLIGSTTVATSIQTAGTSPSYGMYISSTASGNIVSNNTVAGITATGTAGGITGIRAGGGTASVNSVQNNTVQKIALSNAGGSQSFTGIDASGLIDMGGTTANLIGSTSVATSIQLAGTGNFVGIQLGTSSGSICSNNTVAGITCTGANANYGINCNVVSATSVQNNTVRDFTLSNTGSQSFYGISVGSGPIDIGSTTANLIGSTTVATSIQLAGTGACYGIYLNTAATNGQVVSNNTVAGITSTGANTNYGIYFLAVGTASVTSVQNNTIQKITLSNTGVQTFYGIYALAGLFDIGGTSGNLIGSTTVATSIQIAGGAGTFFYGINLGASATSGHVVSNNIIAGITSTGVNTNNGIDLTAGTASATSVQNNTIRDITLSNAAGQIFRGILTNAGLYDIGGTTGNLIGSTTVANSISFAGTGACTGIHLLSSATSGHVVSNNTIAGITSTGVNTNRGLFLQGAGVASATSIQNNAVRNITLSNVGAQIFQGIAATVGLYDIGGTTGNLIGSTTVANSISLAGTGASNGILVNSAAGTNGFVVSNNTISGITSTGVQILKGIYFQAVGTGAAASVQNNVIQKIAVNSTGASSFYGIHVSAGSLNIGTTTGNLIGHSTTANSISFAGTGICSGIYFAGGTTCSIGASGTGNTIANISISNTTASPQLLGINIPAGAATYIANANTIFNLSSASTNTGTGASSSVIGILSAANTNAQTISQNTIHDLSNSSVAATSVEGITFLNTTTTVTNLIHRNWIHTLTSSSTDVNARIMGIDIVSGVSDYYNNMISLGNSLNAASFPIYGIYKNIPQNNNFYFNTVYISGSPTSLAGNSYAFHRNSAATDIIENNIFYNGRSNNGATGKHYGCYLASAATLTLNYNDYAATGTEGYIGYNAGDISVLPISGDANSVIFTAVFSGAPTDVHLDANSNTTICKVGLAIAYTTDFDNTTRNNPPTLGAHDITCSALPIELLYFTGTNTGSVNILNWVTATEINNDYFTLERSEDAVHFTPFATIQGAGNSSMPLSYQHIDTEPFQLTYYRLKQTDFDGKFTYSKIISVNTMKEGIEIIRIFPNPASDNFQYVVTTNEDTQIKINITDAAGRIVAVDSKEITAGKNELVIDVSSFSEGAYIIMAATGSGLYRAEKMFVVQP